jgi:hypothetical protein
MVAAEWAVVPPRRTPIHTWHEKKSVIWDVSWRVWAKNIERGFGD